MCCTDGAFNFQQVKNVYNSDYISLSEYKTVNVVLVEHYWLIYFFRSVNCLTNDMMSLIAKQKQLNLFTQDFCLMCYTIFYVRQKAFIPDLTVDP